VFNYKVRPSRFHRADLAQRIEDPRLGGRAAPRESREVASGGIRVD
jgi:hypothetical protein